MTESLERDNIIALLKGLGSDRDEAVLEAARQVHAQITLAGITWEELLVPDVTADDGDDVEYHDTEDETPEPPIETAKKDTDSLAVIDELLAKTGISEDLRKEMENYKSDLAEGTFEEADRQYIRAVRDRLLKRR